MIQGVSDDLFGIPRRINFTRVGCKDGGKNRDEYGGDAKRSKHGWNIKSQKVKKSKGQKVGRLGMLIVD